MMADTNGYDTRLISSRTDDALGTLERMRVQKVAVNMSFAIVPCSVLDDFLANKEQFETFEAYLEALAGQEVDELMEAVLRVAGETRDPLLGLISDIQGSSADHVFVASAGNFALRYQTYPAAHEAVVGVSASEAQNLRRLAFFSSMGEVSEAGAWFTATNPYPNINGHHQARSFVAYAGTSFSAPDVAVFSALDLSRARPACGVDGNGIPFLSHGGLKSTPLEDAVSSFCP